VVNCWTINSIYYRKTRSVPHFGRDVFFVQQLRRCLGRDGRSIRAPPVLVRRFRLHPPAARADCSVPAAAPSDPDVRENPANDLGIIDLRALRLSFSRPSLHDSDLAATGKHKRQQRRESYFGRGCLIVVIQRMAVRAPCKGGAAQWGHASRAGSRTAGLERFGGDARTAGSSRSGTVNSSGSRQWRSLMHRSGRDQAHYTDTQLTRFHAPLDAAFTADHAALYAGESPHQIDAGVPQFFVHRVGSQVQAAGPRNHAVIDEHLIE